MKFITVRQPYAALLVSGRKTIERRPTDTSYRGLLAIHAGKKQLEVPEAFQHELKTLPPKLLAARGCVIGVVELVDVRLATEDDRDAMLADPEVGQRRRAWLVSGARALSDFLPLRGLQGIRELPKELVAQIERQLAV